MLPDRDGVSVKQWFIPLLCLVPTLIFVGDAAARGRTVLAILVAAGGLTLHFNRLVHGPDVTGNPYLAMRYDFERKQALRECLWTLEPRARRETSPVAPGWLSERMPEVGRLCAGARVEVHPLWHSALTGLHSKRIVRMELWSPGGRLRAALMNLEWRDRHE